MIWFKHRHAMLQEAKRANNLRKDLIYEVCRSREDFNQMLMTFQCARAAASFADLIDMLLEKEKNLASTAQQP